MGNEANEGSQYQPRLCNNVNTNIATPYSPHADAYFTLR